MRNRALAEAVGLLRNEHLREARVGQVTQPFEIVEHARDFVTIGPAREESRFERGTRILAAREQPQRDCA